MKSLLLPTVTALLNSNCTTPDAATRCQGSCTRENYECVSRCPPSDSSCHAECSRQAVQCEERCPCMGELCWAGCPCVDNPGTEACGSDVDFLGINPSSKYGGHHLLRWQGSQRRSWDITFEPKLKATSGGCGAVVKNQLFIFGGSKNTVQHVVGCRAQIGTPMPFVFNNGICASVDGGEKALLCSTRSSPTDCHRFNGIGYERIPRTLRGHNDGGVVDGYGTYFIVAGGQDAGGSGGNIDVEAFEHNTNRWTHVGDLKSVLGPTQHRFKMFSMAAINNKIYTFGGRVGTGTSPTSNVFMMDRHTYEWTRSPQQMSTPRAKHRTLMVGANILLLGGTTSSLIDAMYSGEKWNIGHNEVFTITTARWPEVLGSTDGSPFEVMAVENAKDYTDCVHLPPLPSIRTPTV